ncbi:hypothetical protein DRE_00925 [Drechslerella stenobrocha 248]|uniref:Uncharacterized protein n=1 Tax=Drechslerella stenobrocha 248 TaxID=1043628 RepID=W7HLI9_9PEZI|nr:hypothetical protein DRE_00925 [Drechslerella stenobrocha 248]
MAQSDVTRYRDPVLSEHFGPNYDENMVYVLINPRALAWELVGLNGDNSIDEDTGQPLNPWVVPEDDPRALDPMYQKEYVLIDADDLSRMGHLGLRVADDEAAITAANRNRQPEVDGGNVEINLWFENQKRQSEELYRVAAGLDSGQSSSAGTSGDDTEDSHAVLDEDAGMVSNDENCGNNANVQKGGGQRASKKRYRQPYQYLIPEVSDARVNDDSYSLTSKVVQRQLQLAYAPKENEDGNLEAETPRFCLEVIAFHKERLRALERRGIARQTAFQQQLISFNADHVMFSSTDPRLFVPLTNSSPDVRAWIMRGQNEMQFMLDLMRVQWDRLGYLDRYFNRKGRKTPKSRHRGFGNQKAGAIRLFGNLRHHHKNVLKLAVELFCKDLKGQLEADMGELLRFGTFQYIAAGPEQDIRMRHALFVLWEIKLVGTVVMNEQEGQQGPCSCWARRYLSGQVVKYNVHESYQRFFATGCMQDHHIIDTCLKEEYSAYTPHPLEDIALQYIRYSARGAFIPAWMADRHKLVVEISRETRKCFLEDSSCHGSARDHVQLVLRAVWGYAYILSQPTDSTMFEQLSSDIHSFITETDGAQLKQKGKALGKRMLGYDLKLVKERREFRKQETSREKEGRSQGRRREQSPIGYVAQRATEVLGAGYGGRAAGGTDIPSQMREKGWRKRGTSPGSERGGLGETEEQDMQFQPFHRPKPRTLLDKMFQKTEAMSLTEPVGSMGSMPKTEDKKRKEKTKGRIGPQEREDANEVKDHKRFVPGTGTKMLLHLLGAGKALD